MKTKQELLNNLSTCVFVSPNKTTKVVDIEFFGDMGRYYAVMSDGTKKIDFVVSR